MSELYGSEVHSNLPSVIYLIYPVGTVRRNNREASPETVLSWYWLLPTSDLITQSQLVLIITDQWPHHTVPVGTDYYRTVTSSHSPSWYWLLLTSDLITQSQLVLIITDQWPHHTVPAITLILGCAQDFKFKFLFYLLYRNSLLVGHHRWVPLTVCWGSVDWILVYCHDTRQVFCCYELWYGHMLVLLQIT